MAKKILLIGRGGVGKTSIKQVIFEGKDPKNLILFPLDPTRGISTSLYKWMDLELGLFDTSGQELPLILEDETYRNRAFENCDVIIYTLDYLSWISQSEEIVEEIQIIYNIVKKFGINIKFIIFFHKVDLLNQKFKDNFHILEQEIKNSLALSIEFKVYFTSLHPNFIYNTFNAFFEILSGLSKKNFAIKSVIDSILKSYNKIACFITDQHNSIIIQTITPDFEINLINKIHKKLAQMDQTSESLLGIFEKMFLIDIGSKILSMILINFENINFDIKKLICISEIYEMDKLLNIIKELKTEIINFYEMEK